MAETLIATFESTEDMDILRQEMSDLKETCGYLKASVEAQQRSLHDFWSLIRERRTEDAQNYTSLISRHESFVTAITTDVEQIKVLINKINSTLDTQSGADGVWRVIRHAVTAFVSSVVSALTVLYISHKQ